MNPRHVALMKARQGEFLALKNTEGSVADGILPLFEVGRLTDDIRQRKYLRDSATPVATYLERITKDIFKAWGMRPLMVDGFFWPPNAYTELGDHVISHMVSALRQEGAFVIPVVGYDRWEHREYKAALKAIQLTGEHACCLRLESNAISDAAEPDFFQQNVEAILSELGVLPSQCSVLIDFGDVSTASVDQLLTSGLAIVEQLSHFGFRYFITAGCSIPKSIELAVKAHDTSNMVLRREVVLWKALRQSLPDVPLAYGDYCVRGPFTNDDIRSRYINGKIRHTVDQHTFLMRGHPFSNDGNHNQMHGLADKVAKSGYYLGPNFSWGDKQLQACRLGMLTGGPKDWIAFDTSHHLAFVAHEVAEFEQSIVVRAPSPAS